MDNKIIAYVVNRDTGEIIDYIYNNDQLIHKDTVTKFVVEDDIYYPESCKVKNYKR